MISIKDAITELDQQTRFRRKCLALWRGSLRAVEIYSFPLFPESARRVEEDWQQVHKCLEEDAPDEVLESTPRLVERVLHNYAQAARKTQREHLSAVKEILEAMSNAAQSVRGRTDCYSAVLVGVSETLARLVDLDDAEELRQELGRESATLRESLAVLVREGETAMSSMEADLAQFRERLAEAESAACTDALTGLSSRRELERQMDRRVRQRRQFCAIMLDVDEFKSINDRFGHDCGDQVLRSIANLLSDLVRPGDVVARWGGDEYFILLDCGMKDAMRRTEQISVKLARRYEIKWNGMKLELPVRTSAGVVECAYGESATELFRRADEAMYAAKRGARAKPAREAATS